jgi:hypothetical protein
MGDSILSHFDDEEEFEECLNRADSATAGRKEMEFVDDLKEKWEEYRVSMFLSYKQAEWLKRIAGWED